MFKLIVGDAVPVQLKGKINDAGGKPSPFDITLTMDRATSADFRDLRELAKAVDRGEAEDVSMSDWLTPRVRDWKGVTDEEGQPLPCSESNVRELFNVVGMAGIAMDAYTTASGVQGREKNLPRQPATGRAAS